MSIAFGGARGMAEAQAALGHRPSAFVLRHGIAAPVAPLPPDVEPGVMGHCYANAALIALSRADRFVYCEGFAVRLGLPVPMEHAWLYDLETRSFVDPTWPEADGDYFGVPFRTDHLAATVVRLKTWGLIGNGDPPPEDPAVFPVDLERIDA